MLSQGIFFLHSRSWLLAFPVEETLKSRRKVTKESPKTVSLSVLQLLRFIAFVRAALSSLLNSQPVKVFSRCITLSRVDQIVYTWRMAPEKFSLENFRPRRGCSIFSGRKPPHFYGASLPREPGEAAVNTNWVFLPLLLSPSSSQPRRPRGGRPPMKTSFAKAMAARFSINRRFSNGNEMGVLHHGDSKKSLHFDVILRCPFFWGTACQHPFLWSS